MDWALPTDEILAAAEILTPNECNIAPTRLADSGMAAKNTTTSQLRKLVTQLKLVSTPEALRVRGPAKTRLRRVSAR